MYIISYIYLIRVLVSSLSSEGDSLYRQKLCRIERLPVLVSDASLHKHVPCPMYLEIN
jgi:hypothetical protein